MKRGRTAVAIIIPKGFGDASGKAFFGNGEKPPLTVLYDPSHAVEVAMVRGILTQHVMEAVSKEMFGGEQGRAVVDADAAADRSVGDAGGPETRPRRDAEVGAELLQAGGWRRPGRSTRLGQAAQRGITMPYTVHEEAMTAGSNIAYNGYAHSFGGMAIQFLLFAMANAGIEMLLERQRGLWKRLRSAPVSRLTLLAGKAASGAIISLMILLVSFALRDDRVSACASRAASSGFWPSRSPAR